MSPKQKQKKAFKACQCGNPECDISNAVQKTADALSTSFSTAALLFSTAKSAGGAVPGLKEAAGGLLGIITLVQDMGDVKGGFAQLIREIGKILVVVIRWIDEQPEGTIGGSVKRAIKEFQCDVVLIRQYAEDMNKRNPLLRFINGSTDKAVLAGFQQRVRSAENNLTTQINLDTNAQVRKNARVGIRPEQMEAWIDKMFEVYEKRYANSAPNQTHFPLDQAHPPRPTPLQHQATPPKQHSQASGYSSQQQWSQGGGQYGAYGPHGGYSEEQKYGDQWNNEQQYYDHQAGYAEQGYGYGSQGGWNDSGDGGYWDEQEYDYYRGQQYPQAGGYPQPNGPPHGSWMHQQSATVNHVGSVGNAIFGNNYGVVNQG